MFPRWLLTMFVVVALFLGAIGIAILVQGGEFWWGALGPLFAAVVMLIAVLIAVHKSK